MALVHVRGWDPRFIASHALLWPLASAARALQGCAEWPSLPELDALHAARAGRRGAHTLRFMAQEKPPRRSAQPVALGERYDARIALHHEVPTRACNWHDLLNALCFVTFPNAKLALHTRQYQALRTHVPEGALRMPSARTPEQDALTLFDEGGVVIAATEDTARALSAAAPHDYATSPVFAAALASYERAGQARVVPFGHALFEHMVEGLPCPGASARVVAVAELPADDDALLDLVDDAFTRCVTDAANFRASREAFHLRLE